MFFFPVKNTQDKTKQTRLFLSVFHISRYCASIFSFSVGLSHQIPRDPNGKLSIWLIFLLFSYLLHMNSRDI